MYIAVISVIVALAVFALLNAALELHIVSSVSKIVVNQLSTFVKIILQKLGKINFVRRTDREKRQILINQKDTLVTRYNRMIDKFISDFNLSEIINIESFTSILAAIIAVCVIIFSIFLKNIPVSFLISVSIVIFGFSFFSMKSRMINAERADAIADAEDAICPLAREGVFHAIKKVMETDEYIAESIRPYFRDFIENCETRGYSFRQAMTELQSRLGSRFDNFAKKAIIFEYNERKGMADIFLDIVDENAIVREINLKKEEQFKKMNRDFFMKVMLIVLFFIYALTVPEFKAFMFDSTLGKFINALCLNVICISFSAGQFLQGSLELKHKTSPGNKK